jgi:uncharacterized ion transporter superfamily protein YfcC
MTRMTSPEGSPNENVPPAVGGSMRIRLPHPVVLLLLGVVFAAVLTWILPAGEYQRRDDAATGRQVVVPGTYRAVEPAPVGPLATAVAVPRGLVEAGEVIVVVLLAGGLWVMVDRLGVLGRVVQALLRRYRNRGLFAIPAVAFFFALMGALENMQEEIIPLVPVLLALGAGIGVDGVTVVAMSAGAAMIGSAFSPVNPFQAGIALKVMELPALSAGGLRSGMLLVGFLLWVGLTLRHAVRNRVPLAAETVETSPPLSRRDWLLLAAAIGPMFVYVAGAFLFGWGFNELSGLFLIGGLAVGWVGRLGVAGTTAGFLEGMQSLLPAAVLIGVARSISLVLADGRVVDTILHGLATPLAGLPAAAAAVLMVPVQALVHIPVPSVSGQAVLTLPILAPLGDLLGLSRQVTVLAYQTGAGLMELVTPTNGALMAILLAAGVPYQRWLRFVATAAGVMLLVGVGGIGVALWLGV